MEFTLKTIIKAPIDDVYQAWLDSKGHTEMTGGMAEVSNEIGGTFSAWDGYISGKNLDLAENKRILQSWRTSEFNEQEADSILEISFEKMDTHTALVLKHSNLPEHGNQYIQGWEDHYFAPMKKHFES